MTHFTPETLYGLLPAIYRIRDAEGGGPLRALVEVLGRQARVVEDDIARLYENGFIETCDEWVVPYLGDLLGVSHLHAFGTDAAFSQRARVANTLAYRRRKGTATMLEQLARDTTGWPARAVEFFEGIATTQHVNHVRLHNRRAPDLRDTNRLELLDTAFDTIAHTADVRRIASGRGRHNIPNVGLFLWRLPSYFVEESEARPVTVPPDGRYHFHPYGLDAPLFNRPQTEPEITHLAEEHHVPGPLRRRPLYDELEARRQALADGAAPEAVYFGTQPVLQVFLDDAPDPVPPEEVLLCNLEAWHVPADTKPYTRADGVIVALPIAVAVDPVLGRLTFPVSVAPERVRVSYAYGFPGDVGGGPYNRRTSLNVALDRPVDWQAAVGKSLAPDATHFNTLTDAVAAWNALPAGTVGAIAVVDNASYVESLIGAATIEIPEDSLLVIAAAGWPAPEVPGRLEPDGKRAHLQGTLAVRGTAPLGSTTPGTLVLDGLLVEGRLEVRVGHLGRLRVAHSTVGLQDPDNPVGLTVAASVNAADQNPELVVALDHSLCGPVEAPDTIREVRLSDSVVQAPSVGGVRGPVLSAAGGAFGPPATIERCTLLGSVSVRELTLASESLFTEPVAAERLQVGCVRFSFVPEGSRTPRRFRCQPQLALRQRAEALGLTSVDDLPTDEVLHLLRRLRPAFTATRYGAPAYAQLAPTSAVEIRTGAEDASEMGVWSLLKQPQRIANLESSLDEYLRFGLEAGLVFAT